MSAVKHTRCDGCGNVTSGNPVDAAWDCALRWGQLIVCGKPWDLCPDCAAKAMEAAGVGE